MTGGVPAKPRVLLCGPYPPPYGGIASLMVSLVGGLKGEYADDVTLVQWGDKTETKVVNGITIYTFHVRSEAKRLLSPTNWPIMWNTWATLGGYRFTAKEILFEATKAALLTEVADRHGSNVVSFYQSDASLELLACRKTWGRRRGITLKVFGEIYDTPESIKSRAPLYRDMLAAPEAVTSSSAHCAKAFRSIGVEREIGVVYVGVDLERFHDDGSLRRSYRQELAVDDATPVLLFMGRFNSRMGLDGLLKAVPGLVAESGNFHLVLAGAKGGLTDEALKVQSQYPKHITVMNDVPGKLLPSLYAASDIVLTPSRDQHACMGVTIKEAMAASRAVIGTDSGGIPEAIVQGETGFIVPLNPDGSVDPDGLRRAILSLMSDSGRRTQMGAKARARAIDLFSEEATLRRSTAAFERAVPR